MNVTVPPEYDGERCDLVVSRLAGISRSRARELIESGGVSCDGVAVSAVRHVVRTGEVLSFEPPPDRVGLESAPLDFGVVHEDAHLAVIEKPPGVVTHPGAGRTGVTLAAGVLHRWPSVRGVGTEDRWGIVHRLDRDTSGLMVVALTAEADVGLRAAIKAHQITREYLTLVHGAPAIASGTIEAPLGRDPVRPTRIRIDPNGRPATTHYRIEERLGDMTLLRVTLESGRTHQVRVHLASIGFPIAGDRTYGRGSGSPRVFLHSARLAFDHPVTGERVDVVSPLPSDLAGVLEQFR
ncbi:MAG: RluA family pseudouridine synthase [Actinomycetota bacterium]